MSTTTKPTSTTETSALSTQSMSLGIARDRLNSIMYSVISKAYPTATSLPTNMIFPTKLDFGDYQCNVAMILSKQLKSKPQDVAKTISNELVLHKDIISGVTISGPGFINLQLSEDYISQRIRSMLHDSSHRLGLPPLKVDQQKRVIVDFSSPNIAKEMHVGHLRSTIIGDTISRVLEFIGYDVLRLNHVGDWGTQFGMLIHYMKTNYPDAIRQYLASSNNNNKEPATIGKEEYTITAIEDLVLFYKAAKKSFDENANQFQDQARLEVVKLQSGDPENIALWQAICKQSRKEFQYIYELLNIQLNERGESFYNSYLEDVVDYLQKKGIAVDSQGATCVFVPGYSNTDGTPLPLIVKKSGMRRITSILIVLTDELMGLTSRWRISVRYH
jgi:arginyl-tRNA synthetase